jgi:hypothetical protein
MVELSNGDVISDRNREAVIIDIYRTHLSCKRYPINIKHALNTKGPLRLRATSRDVARRPRVYSINYIHATSRDVARRCSAERQKRRSNRTRLDFSGIDDAQLSGVARRRAQSECCRSYQCVRFQRRRATSRAV